jgi:hypothetical protein
MSQIQKAKAAYFLPHIKDRQTDTRAHAHRHTHHTLEVEKELRGEEEVER